VESHSPGPRVSIILLCYNKLELTRACIESLAQTDPKVDYEVIVVDNGSEDETPNYLECLEGDVQVHRIYPNVGFIRGNNQGAKLARGEFLLFLNNDTVLLPNWLEPMVELMDEDPKVGAVSPMLVFPDGRVNDAGGLIFADGECWRYGMWDQTPDNPKLQSRRASDYAMGACLLVRRELWEKIGGFDERFIPAYYEDTDLAMAIRSHGYKVMYEPASRIIHVEGGTNGTGQNSESTRLQDINRVKFAEKWSDELAHRPKMHASIIENWAHRGLGGFGPHEEPVETWNEAIVRSQDSKKVLVFDPLPPMYDRNSGHRRLWNMLEELRWMGHSVTYFSNSTFALAEYKPKLSKLGIPLYGLDTRYGTQETISDFHREVFVPNFPDWGARQHFDTIIINFWYLAEQIMPYVRAAWPKATIVVDSVDLHYLREKRQAELYGEAQLYAKARATRDKELAVYKNADRVICCTEDDAGELRKELPDADIVVVTNTHELLDEGPGFEAREGILFVGNFAHPANADGMLWWRDEISPQLAAELPGVPLTVVGHDPSGVVPQLVNEKMNSVGWIEDLTPYLNGARISVAPLRFGAGMKGKVGEALSAGLPVICTTIAAEGMDLVDEQDVLIADDADAFVKNIVRLYNDSQLWNQLRTSGREIVEQRWGKESLRGPLGEVLMPPRKLKNPKKPTNKRYTPPAKARQ
jgi:GT2 family glycosyltransferase/glycosyltransferase involved in cell wall biosynthesis